CQTPTRKCDAGVTGPAREGPASRQNPVALEDAAEPGRVRPRAEAEAAPAGAFRRPDLLERRPVVGRSLAAQERRRVVRLERQVHLEAAVVGSAAVSPRRLVAVDAEPRAAVGRVERLPARMDGADAPQVAHPTL